MLRNQRVIFINMKNFSILDENGKEWWISRSIAVTGCIFTFLNGKWYVLANKRGKGTADFQGMWNMPCGYLDFNETTAEAVIREVYEETGVKVNPDYLQFWCFNDSPTQNRQNVSFRYYALIDAQPGTISVGTGNDRGGEEDEVEAIGWIPVDTIGNYKWAFGHDEIIKDFVEWMHLEDDYFDDISQDLE